MKKPSEIDVAVLIIFFTRVEPLKRVFDEVRKARPSRLYLHQDGPRAGRNDEEALRECRELFEEKNIDWECEVHRLYQEKNLGCDPAEYVAQKWFFEQEEMGIVLEDDDVPSQSFFPFAKELLERYKDDERVSIICGTNPLGVSTNTQCSYLFAKAGSIWGWASWRRFFELEDPTYAWLEKPEEIAYIKSQLRRAHFREFMKAAKQHKDAGIAYYETLYQAAQYLSNGYAIVPKYNLITNVGVTEDSTHNVADVRLLPKRIQKMFTLERYELEFPLKHPDCLIKDDYYEKRRVGSSFSKYVDRAEHGVRVLWFQGPVQFMRRIIKRVRRKL